MPIRSRGENRSSANLAEGEELGSNLLRVAASSLGSPGGSGALGGGREPLAAVLAACSSLSPISSFPRSDREMALTAPTACCQLAGSPNDAPQTSGTRAKPTSTKAARRLSATWRGGGMKTNSKNQPHALGICTAALHWEHQRAIGINSSTGAAPRRHSRAGGSYRQCLQP